VSGPFLPTDEPIRSHETEVFWDALDDERFVLPRCDNCAHVIWYPRLFCPICHTAEVSWFDASGRGDVYSFTVVRQSFGPWKDAAPYVIAYVELDEGPRVLTNVVDCDAEAIAVGDRVEVVFERSPKGAAVYRFAPVTGPTGRRPPRAPGR
jgi:uncharacterized OB-fold protein